ncbi:unnamed protein product [Ceutorhynchus assimilis]|uniref:Regulatory protein zeste n=1 Tax=Ceutorhynchus assimilis TaxID=467358 RepID=A0A9N9MZ81_9CUCU|nr:unnamed protein product [Ceutorhynchus assimilis]
MAESKRVPNFTQAEKTYLINLISQKYGKILEDKKTNRTSVDEKKEVWKEIEERFNASGPMVCFRNADSLRWLYENKKKELRKKLGEEKKQRHLTGGGTMPLIVIDDLDKILMSVLNEKCLTGIQSRFDCDDEDEEMPIIMQSAQSGDYVFEFVPDTGEDRDENVAEQNEKENFSLVQTDVQKIGNVKKIKNPNTSINNNNINVYSVDNIETETTSGTPAWKKFKTDNLKLPLNSALRCTGRSGETPTSKPTNRRRPMINRALTTSDISEKYNLLLDRRLTLLEKQLGQHEENAKFQKEEQKLKQQPSKILWSAVNPGTQLRRLKENIKFHLIIFEF